MNYILVLWKHNSSEYPIELYSEINDQSFEIRKIEIYKNGKIGIASQKIELNDTFLGIEPIPELNVINNNPEFHGIYISKYVFEAKWKEAEGAATADDSVSD